MHDAISNEGSLNEQGADAGDPTPIAQARSVALSHLNEGGAADGGTACKAVKVSLYRNICWSGTPIDGLKFKR